MLKLVKVPCERCGKEIMTPVKDPYGMDDLKAKWGNLCEDCVTPKEERQMIMEIGMFLAVQTRRN